MKQYLLIIIAVIVTAISSTLIFNHQLRNNLWVNKIKEIEKQMASLSWKMQTLSWTISDRKIDIENLIDVQDKDINKYMELSGNYQAFEEQKEKIWTALFYLDAAANGW